MAKGKHAAALFEVIQSSRFKNRPDPLRTPRWWFKRSPKSEGLSASSVLGAPAQSTASATAPATSATPALTPTAPFSTTSVDPTAVVATPAAGVPAGTASGLGTGLLSSLKRPIPGVDLRVDQDQHQIMFKLSYNSAIVTAFTVLVIVGLAYVVGRKMHHAPVAVTNSPSTEQLRAEPAHPDVLKVKSASAGTELLTKKNADDAQLAGSKQAKSVNENATSAPASVDAERVIGRQYVIIQSYTDEKTANDIAAMLVKNSVPCSVIKALPNWGRADLYSIVGTTGFDRIRSNSEFDHYEANIVRIGEQLAAGGKFKRFEPRGYRWKGIAG